MAENLPGSAEIFHPCFLEEILKAHDLRKKSLRARHAVIIMKVLRSKTYAKNAFGVWLLVHVIVSIAAR